MNNRKINLYYEITMGVLALVAVVFAIIDLTDELNAWQTTLDTIILIVFIVDYFTRLYLAKEKLTFFKQNIFDLVSIIPFSSFFKAFRIVRIMRIAKLAKLFRVFAYTMRFSKKAKVFLNTNGFKYVLMLTVFMIGLGGFLIHYAEGMSFLDGFWWAFVTATTVGYGDISPSTVWGRIIAIVLMIVGIGLLGTLTSTITSFFLNLKSDKSKSSTIDFIKSQVDNLDELDNDEIDRLVRIIETYKNDN